MVWFIDKKKKICLKLRNQWLEVIALYKSMKNTLVVPYIFVYKIYSPSWRFFIREAP